MDEGLFLLFILNTDPVNETQGRVLLQAKPPQAVAGVLLYRQIGQYARQTEIAHADETTHYRKSEQRWLWCLATPLAVYMLVHWSRGKVAAKELLGSVCGVLVTDHYSGYNDYARHLRQLCWAHRNAGPVDPAF